MQRIAIDRLVEGMIVDEPVRDLHGTILLQKGISITRDGVRLLKMWGVLEVSIDDKSASEHPQSAPPPVDPRAVAEANAAVATLFQHTDDKNPFVMELMRLATERAIKSIEERTS